MESSPSAPQPSSFPSREGPYLRLLCVNIFVRDQERSLRFYVGQLGFGVVVDENYESGDRWVAVAPPDGNTVLALVKPKRNSEEFKLIGRSRHAVLVTEDVMAKFEEWQNRGVRFHHPPQTTLWGGIFTRFDDVDGNSFALVGRDDFVREIETQRRAAAEKLEAERRTAQELEIAIPVRSDDPCYARTNTAAHGKRHRFLNPHPPFCRSLFRPSGIAFPSPMLKT